jgi:hypothetical protein
LSKLEAPQFIQKQEKVVNTSNTDKTDNTVFKHIDMSFEAKLLGQLEQTLNNSIAKS